MDQSIQILLTDCTNELSSIQDLINGLGTLSKPVPYLTRYSVIKTCGTIEFAVKAIISDKLSSSQHPYVCNFINSKIRNSSMNPSYENITKLLKSLDETLCVNFKNKLKIHPDYSKITNAMSSIIDLRNDFAHGSNINASIQNIVDYYIQALVFINILDDSF